MNSQVKAADRQHITIVERAHRGQRFSIDAGPMAGQEIDHPELAGREDQAAMHPRDAGVLQAEFALVVSSDARDRLRDFDSLLAAGRIDQFEFDRHPVTEFLGD